MRFIKDNVKIIIIGLSCLLVGKFVLQDDPIVVEKEVIVYKESTQSSSQSKKTTTTKEEKKPDGSSTTETTVTEETSNQSSTEVAVDRTTSRETSKASKVTVGILALKDLDQFSKNTHIGILTKAPLVGNLSVIGSFDTTKRVGLGLSLEF